MRTLTRRLFGKYAASSAVALALVSSGARQTRAGYNCNIATRECRRGKCTGMCYITCKGGDCVNGHCAACAVCDWCEL